MNTAKKLLILLVLLAVTSCDSWLDVTSSSQVRSEEQFETEAGFKDALIGVYINMADESLYSRDLTWNMVDLVSQQYAPLSSLALYSEIQQFEYRTTASAPRVDAVWNRAYHAIANINNALAYIEKNGEVLDTITRDIIKGELLGLRAFLHFDLMRLYGKGNLAEREGVFGDPAIPYVREYTKNITPQESYEKTFQYLEEDLAKALELLKSDPMYSDPERPEGFYDGINQEGFLDNRQQRMNYYAAKGLQARVLLWQGRPEKVEAAKDAAEEVIAEAPVALINSESYAVSSDPILYQENLFSLYVTAFEDVVNSFQDAGDQSNYDAVYLTSATVEEVYETADANVGPPDIRYNTLLESQSLGYASKKLFQENNLSNPDLMPLMKLPEMYYIAAEYYLNDGQTAQAIDYLNTVRTSRGIIAEIPQDAAEEQVRQELLKEFRKEFVSEGQLFYKYKRLGLETIPGTSQSRVADDQIYVLPYPDGESEFRTSN